MKLVDDVLICAGLYRPLLKLIDEYDGDTHMDAEIQRIFRNMTLEPFRYVAREFQTNHHSISPKQLLFIVLASDPTHRQSIACYGSSDQSFMVAFINRRFFPGQPLFSAPIYLRSDLRIVAIFAPSLKRNPGFVWYLHDPTYRKFIFHASPQDVFPGCKKLFF